MAEKKKTAGWLRILCTAAAAFLLAACARPQDKPVPAPPPPLQAEAPVTSEALQDFRARIPAVISPPQRAAQMSALTELVEQLALDLERETRDYNRALDRLMASPQSTRAQFLSLRAGFEKKRQELWHDLTDNLFTLKAMADRQEWRQLTERDNQAPLFTAEDPRRLRTTISALEIRVNETLTDPPLRSRVMTILKRAGREAAPLDRHAAVSEAQISRLFISYDARPASFRQGLSRFASAKDALFEELTGVVFELRAVLSPQQWQRLFS